MVRLQTKFCEHFLNDSDKEVQEDYNHTLYHCPNTKAIIDQVTTTFFPDINTLRASVHDLSDSRIDKPDVNCWG